MTEHIEEPFWISIGDWMRAQYGQRADYKTVYSQWEVGKILKDQTGAFDYTVYDTNGVAQASCRRAASVLVFPPGKVVVSAKVLRGLDACRESCACNMLDMRCVQKWLFQNTWVDALTYTERCELEYCEGVMRGFRTR